MRAPHDFAHHCHLPRFSRLFFCLRASAVGSIFIDLSVLQERMASSSRSPDDSPGGDSPDGFRRGRRNSFRTLLQADLRDAALRASHAGSEVGEEGSKAAPKSPDGRKTNWSIMRRQKTKQWDRIKSGRRRSSLGAAGAALGFVVRVATGTR